MVDPNILNIFIVFTGVLMCKHLVWCNDYLVHKVTAVVDQELLLSGGGGEGVDWIVEVQAVKGTGEREEPPSLHQGSGGVVPRKNCRESRTKIIAFRCIFGRYKMVLRKLILNEISSKRAKIWLNKQMSYMCPFFISPSGVAICIHD
jgi:hypothetical protein